MVRNDPFHSALYTAATSCIPPSCPLEKRGQRIFRCRTTNHIDFLHVQFSSAGSSRFSSYREESGYCHNAFASFWQTVRYRRLSFFCKSSKQRHTYTYLYRLTVLDVKQIFIDFILYLQIILILNWLWFDIICFFELLALNSSTIYSKISHFFVTAHLNTSYIYMIHILNMCGLFTWSHAYWSSRTF